MYCAKSFSPVSENTKKAQKWSIFKLEISASENTKNPEIKEFCSEKIYCAKSVSSASDNTKKAQKWSIFKFHFSASENRKKHEIKLFL